MPLVTQGGLWGFQKLFEPIKFVVYIGLLIRSNYSNGAVNHLNRIVTYAVFVWTDAVAKL